MFEDAPTPVVCRPSRARLRAMARQIATTLDDEDDTIGGMIQAAKKLPQVERLELQRLVNTIQPPEE